MPDGTKDPMARCHVYKGAFIPGCMGGAVYGRSGCTCDPKGKPGLGAQVEKLEGRLKILEEFVYRNVKAPTPTPISRGLRSGDLAAETGSTQKES